VTNLNPADNTRDYGVEALGDDYPFVRVSSDARGILSDLWLSHEMPDLAYPLSVLELHHFGRPLQLDPPGPPDEHQCDVVIGDRHGTAVFDTRPAAVRYTGRAFGPRFYVHEWLSETFVLRVVQHVSVALDTSVRERAVDTETGEEWRLVEAPAETPRVVEQDGNPLGIVLLPQVAELDERTHMRLPRRVKRIHVGDQVLSGPLIIQAGFNIDISDSATAARPVPSLVSAGLGVRVAADEGLRPTTRLTLSAVAGAGAGVFPLCTSAEDRGVSSINGVTGDQETGRFTLTAKGCTYVRQPSYATNLQRLAPAYLRLGNQCTVCRPCSKYVDAYERGLRVYDQLRVTAGRLRDDVGRYHQMRDRWQDVKDCCERKPIKVSILGGCKDDRVVITVAVLVANVFDTCLYDVTAEVSIGATGTSGDTTCDSGAEMVPSSNFQTLDNGRTVMAVVEGHWPVFRFRWPVLSPWRAVRAQVTYTWETGGPTGTVTATGIAAAGGTPLPDGAGVSDTAAVDISCLEQISEVVDSGLGSDGVLQDPCQWVV